MALTTVNTTDLYTSGFLAEMGTAPNPGTMVIGPLGGSGRIHMLYQRLDRLFVYANKSSPSLTRRGYVDPLFEDGYYPITNFTQGISSGFFGYVAGQWNRASDVQCLYTVDATAGTGKLQERDPTTLQIIDADPYPLFRNTCIAVGSGVDGYYVAASLDYKVFEEQGKLYIPQVATMRYGGASYTYIAVEVDLATGLAVPIPGWYGRAATGPNAFQEPAIFGDQVEWNRLQFIEDDDSSHVAPKGYFVISEADGHAGVGANPAERVYVRIMEWNPTGASGTPNRVHKRITMTSRVEFDETIIGTGFVQCSLVYHPLSGRLYWIANNGWNPGIAGSNIVYRFSMVPDLAAITAPAPERTPRTAGTTAFNVEALGSLNERIPGVQVAFALEGASAVRELLDTSGGPGSPAAAVDRTPIDDDDGLIVYEDDGATVTALVETTHYTVNRSTGVITGVGVHWKLTSAYYASYNHKEDVDGADALGTLLLPIVTTNSEGKARTRVRYADDDDFEGRFDRLSAETT